MTGNGNGKWFLHKYYLNINMFICCLTRSLTTAH